MQSSSMRQLNYKHSKKQRAGLAEQQLVVTAT
jgi:hypothetical protein